MHELRKDEKRYDDDMAAVQHAAMRAVETLTENFYAELWEARVRRSQGYIPLRDWLADMDLHALLGGRMGDYFTQEFRRLQAVIDRDGCWVEKHLAQYFMEELGLITVELRLDPSPPRFEGVNHMAIAAVPAS